MKKLMVSLAAAFLLVVTSQAQSDGAMRQKVFEAVWSKVNKTFYDPNFNGVDWKAAHDKYAPLAAAAKNDDELYGVIKEMLGLFKVSHMKAGSAAQVAKQFKQAPGVTGIGLRDVEGRITVFRSLPEYPAAKVGIRPGYIVTTVDGKRPADVDEAAKALAGSPGTTVKITYLDEKDAEHETTLDRRPLTDKGKIESLNIYALFDAKRLGGGIGYISFSSFVPFLNDRIDAAFESMKDAPAIILDLRGNSGGDDSVSMKLADHLFVKETQLMLIKTRKGINRDEKARGNKSAYRGKFVVLVDEHSGSAAEDLTAGLQESGRAYVIGKTTMGQDLDARIEMLPDGGMLIYAFGLPTTPKGVIVEGRGVIPNQPVELKRADLLAGRDTQLAAALEYIFGKKL
jgi:carboxyl-terminal processing protease